MARTAGRRFNDELVFNRKLSRLTPRKRRWLTQERKRAVMAVESRKDMMWCRCDRCKNGEYRGLKQRQAEREIVDYFKGAN